MDKRRRSDNLLYTLRDVAPMLHSLITTAGVFACFYFLLHNAFPESNKEIIIFFAGVITGEWKSQQGFYFGSTASSKNKDSAIEEIAKRPVIQQQAPAPPVTVTNAEKVSTETGDVNVTKDTI